MATRHTEKPETRDPAVYSPTAGLPFDDQELESKLVWIYGSQRTGSTWLLEMLCYPLRRDDRQQLGFLWPDSFMGPAYALPVDEFLISRHLFPTHGDTIDTDGKPRAATLNLMLGRIKPSYAFSEEFAEVWQPEARRLTLVRLHAVVVRARRAGLKTIDELPVLAIKEVNGSYAADRVMSLFPRSRMIFMLRDGRDVLDSLAAAWESGAWLDATLAKNAAPGANRISWIRETCRRWVADIDVCMKAYEEHDPELRRMVRYEDLLADTPTVLRDLVHWIGLPANQPRIERIAEHHAFDRLPERNRGPGKFRRSATPGKWREGLTPAEQELAQEIMGSRLAELGYEAEP